MKPRKAAFEREPRRQVLHPSSRSTASGGAGDRVGQGDNRSQSRAGGSSSSVDREESLTDPSSYRAVIDDFDDTRDLYAVMLRLEGFVAEEARDGQEGIAKAIEFLPALIITDLAMPVMDGWETIRRLRADERTRHIPIIACSGDEPNGTHDSSADVLLAKPCSLDTLLLEVRRLLRRDAAPDPGDEVTTRDRDRASSAPLPTARRNSGEAGRS